MILERAAITVRDGDQEAFESAFATARELLAAAGGCESVRLLRGIESPTSYLLLVTWRRLEDHMEGFRSSPAFGEWRSLVGPFFAEPPDVQHFSYADAIEPRDEAGPFAEQGPSTATA